VLPGRCNITVCIDIPVATELAAPLAENCIWRQVRGSGAEISGSDGPATAMEKALVDFLYSLMSSNDDGTIIGAKQKLSRQPEESYLKFVMLCAKKKNSEVTRDAYIVVLASGTLQPIEETTLHLCPSLPPADIKFFT